MYQLTTHYSWVLKAIIKNKDILMNSVTWRDFQDAGRYKTKLMYQMLRGSKPKVLWRKLFFGNLVKPRVVFTLWMTCQSILQIKDRLQRFGIVIDGLCVYCGLQESYNHLFFECQVIKNIWKQMMNQVGINHCPWVWNIELCWVSQITRGKGRKMKLLKMVLAETVYQFWIIQNRIILQDSNKEALHSKEIIELVRVRVKLDRKLAIFCNRS